MQCLSKIKLIPKLQTTVDELIGEANLIPSERLLELQAFANYIQKKRERKEVVKLNFICTHNSRRSHLAQIWSTVAAAYYHIELATYSGGTEATALAPQIASVLQKIGFNVDHTGGDNPSYQFFYTLDQRPIICFSKTYDDDTNPVRAFAAIMTCSEADQECPFIPGADFRLSLPYKDPKFADGTIEEAAAYVATAREIGRELFFVMQQVRLALNK
jgi:arsenate reductase